MLRRFCKAKMMVSSSLSIARRKKYILTFVLIITISIFVEPDMKSYNKMQMDRIMNYINDLSQSLLVELLKKGNGGVSCGLIPTIPKYTREELLNITYAYLKNVSKIHSQEYLTLLNDTLTNFEFPLHYNANNLQKTWPRLIPKVLQVPLSNLTWKGSKLPVLTGYPGGRLGNMMGEYATLYALGRLYNATVFLHPEMKNRIHHIFPFITTKDLPIDTTESTPDNKWIILHRQERDYNYNPLEFAAAGLFGPNLFMFHDYPFEIQLFDFFRQDIIKELRFSNELLKEAKLFLSSVKIDVSKTSKTSEITFVGFHVRRTDYLQHMAHYKGELPGDQFFERAMQHYRQKYTSPVFILASDDRDFLRKTFNGTDLYIAPGKSPEGDMAVLTSCNHSICTVGSYGFWTAYLTGGEVIYPDVHSNHSYCFSKTNYEKTKLSFFTPLEAY